MLILYIGACQMISSGSRSCIVHQMVTQYITTTVYCKIKKFKKSIEKILYINNNLKSEINVTCTTK